MVDIEWGVSHRGMGFVVVRERGGGQPIGPICLSFVDEDTKVLFDFLIDTFGLAIGLRVICGREVRLDTCHGIEVSHELGSELGASVANCLSWKTEFRPHMIAIDASGAEGG